MSLTRQFLEQEKNALRPFGTILSITDDENVVTCLQRLMPLAVIPSCDPLA